MSSPRSHNRQRHTQPAHIVSSLSSRVSCMSVLDVAQEPLVSFVVVRRRVAAITMLYTCDRNAYISSDMCNACYNFGPGHVHAFVGLSVTACAQGCPFLYIHTPSRHPAQMSMLDIIHQGAILSNGMENLPVCCSHTSSSGCTGLCRFVRHVFLTSNGLGARAESAEPSSACI